MWERLRRFNALPLDAKSAFSWAAFLLPLIAVSLRLRGFAATRQWLLGTLSTRTDRTTRSSDAQVTAAIDARMVRAAGRYVPFKTTCLERSLVLCWLLARRHIPAQLRIGVRKQNSDFAAHAWVELDGVPLGEAEEPHQHYAAFEKEFSEGLT